MGSDERYERLVSLVKELLYTSGHFAEMPGSHSSARRMIEARDAIVDLIGEVPKTKVLFVDPDEG